MPYSLPAIAGSSEPGQHRRRQRLSGAGDKEAARRAARIRRLAVKSMKSLDEFRYVGDRNSMIVHDSWNRDSEHCMLDELVDRGHAVGFDPDTLEQSFWEGFDYCDNCFGKKDPTSPYRSRSRGRVRNGRSKHSLGMSLSG